MKAQVKPLPGAQSPPTDLTAEQAVLGAILVKPDNLQKVADFLAPGDFYRTAHGVIYQAMLDLLRRGEPVDLVTVTSLLNERGHLEGVGGPVFLAGLSEQVGFATNAEYYAQLVRDKSLLRQLMDLCQTTAGACLGSVEDVTDFLGSVEAEIVSLSVAVQSFKVKSMETLVADETRVMEDIHYTKKPPGLPTGYPDLDRFISLTPGDLIVLAGRTSMGKTALALNLVYRAAMAGVRVGFFSLEMSRQQIIRRLIALAGRINAGRLNKVLLTPDEWARFYAVRDELQALPLWLDDTPSLSVVDVRTCTRQEMGRSGLGLLVVDYLQLLRPLRRGRSREEEVAEACRGLKALARELQIPVLALAQLSRKVEERPSKRPLLSDLRESGAIEQDADIVLFLYRDEVYRKDSPDKGKAEVIVAKHRNGRTGVVQLAYLKDYLRFESLEKEKSP